MNNFEPSTPNITTQPGQPPTPLLPPPAELLYASGAFGSLLLLLAILKQATRFVEACKK